LRTHGWRRQIASPSVRVAISINAWTWAIRSWITVSIISITTTASPIAFTLFTGLLSFPPLLLEVFQVVPVFVDFLPLGEGALDSEGGDTNSGGILQHVLALALSSLLGSHFALRDKLAPLLARNHGRIHPVTSVDGCHRGETGSKKFLTSHFLTPSFHVRRGLGIAATIPPFLQFTAADSLIVETTARLDHI
jgi:hypothetical protein